MSAILQNSIWPNAGGTLGEIKAQIPDGVTVKWPDGDALVGNFVYKGGKLVGFVDTKALTVNSLGSTTINYDYTNIELPFAEDAMTINRGPRSKYLFIKFNNKEVEEGGSVIVTLKYKGCKTPADILAIDSNYKTTDIVNGVWTEGLGDLETGGTGHIWGGIFCKCSNLTSFSSDLSSLTEAPGMFYQCSNLTSFSSDLSSLTDGSEMFYECSNLTSFNGGDLSSLTNGSEMFYECTNLTSFSSDVSSLTSGEDMFYKCANLASFSSDLSSLTSGENMFWACTSLTSFSSDLSSLTNGQYMFWNCTNLISFGSDLSSLTNGYNMFYECSNLTSFNGGDLSNLTNGKRMFTLCENLTTFTCGNMTSLTEGDSMFYHCFNLTSFESDLSSLTNGLSMFKNCKNLTSFNGGNMTSLTGGNQMFSYCSNLTSFNGGNMTSLTGGNAMFEHCTSLTSFTSDLSSLENGGWMFNDCTSLTSFTSDLSNLTKGDDMFSDCKLDALSVKNIIDTINTYSGKLTLGMGCNNTTEDRDLFAQEVGYADMTSLLAALQAKGWTVTAQYNGRPTTTYGLRKTVENTLPVFVKLEEIEEHADYISEDGSKKYRLDWFHETTGSTEGYTQYATLEEAIEILNIIPIERN